MDFDQLDETHQLIVGRYLEAHVKDVGIFHTAICEKDEMFYKAILPGYANNKNISYFKYLESGKRTMDVVRQIVDHVFGGFSGISSVLEFACGYGRFTRFLVEKIPGERIWVSDIYADAVKWQKKYFGVNGFNSVTDPTNLHDQRKYSFILVGSLFSHLPDRLFKSWLQKLYTMLDTDGLLLFTVHDEHLLPDGESMGRDGIRYFDRSESDSLDGSSYGMTYVTKPYVIDAIEGIGATDKVQYRCFRKALYENQDLWLVNCGSRVDLSTLDLIISPLGGIESCRIDDEGNLILRGWGIDLNDGAQITTVELYANDTLVSCGKAVADRLDVLKFFPHAPSTPVRWRFALPVSDLGGEKLLTCRLISETGATCEYLAFLDRELQVIT